MNTKQYYENGQLQLAISSLSEELKNNPQDIQKRDFLRELLCIAGELERANKQLDLIAEQDPRTTVGVALARQLIRAQQARLQCFKADRTPEFLTQPTPTLHLHLQALTELKQGNPTKSHNLLQKLAKKRPHIRGEYNGIKFNSLRDLDDTCANFFEVLTSNGKYYWIPIENISNIQFHAPEHALDLIWRRANMTIYQNGPEGEVYLPTIYASTDPEDELAQLGRKTDWQTTKDGPVLGNGQRIFLIDDQDVPMMELESLVITT